MGNNIITETFVNFDNDGEKLPICERVITVVEIIRYKGVIIDTHNVRFDFDKESRILKLTNAVNLSFMEIEVCYNIDIFEQRRRKINKLLNDI